MRKPAKSGQNWAGLPTLQGFHMEPAKTLGVVSPLFSIAHVDPCLPCEMLRVQSRTLRISSTELRQTFEEPQLPEASMALLWTGAGSPAAHLSATFSRTTLRPTGGVVVCGWLKIGQQSKGENRGVKKWKRFSWWADLCKPVCQVWILMDWESGHHVHC